MLTFEYIVYIAVTILLHIGVLYFLKRSRKLSLMGRHVVVTGGSSGIGLWAAIYCARLGAHVTIIARNVDALKKAKELIKDNRYRADVQRIDYKSFDLSTSNYEETCDLLHTIENEYLNHPNPHHNPIYMLVNCAGMAICGKIEETSIEDAHKMMDLNYFGTYYPTRYCLAKMKKRNQGIIVITASQAALMGIYGYGAYGASKFALRGLAETIAMETSSYNVSVTLALPADTDTPGFAREEKTKPKETKIISGAGGLAKPEDVAIQIINDALRKKFFSVSGVESWILTILCSGMAPWGGFLLNILIAILIGPLKLVGQLIQWNFRRIVRNCAAAEQQEQLDEARAKRMEKIKELDSTTVRPKRKKAVKRDYDSDE